MLTPVPQEDTFDITDSTTTTVYQELFESNLPRFVKDDEPLINDAYDETRFLTFNQLCSKVRALSAAIRREPFNLQEGDVAAFCSTDDIECFVAIYGITSAGCTACLMMSTLSACEIQHVVRSTSPKAAIVHPDTLSSVKTACMMGDAASMPILVLGTSCPVEGSIVDSVKSREEYMPMYPKERFQI